MDLGLVLIDGEKDDKQLIETEAQAGAFDELYYYYYYYYYYY